MIRAAQNARMFLRNSDHETPCLLCDAAYGITFVFFRTNNWHEFVLKETRCGMSKAEEIEMLTDASDRLVSAVSTDFRRYLSPKMAFASCAGKR